MDAKAEFFARMEAEHQKQGTRSNDPRASGVDFAVTSSGRTTLRDGATDTDLDGMDFSVLTSGRSIMNTDRSAMTVGTIDTNFTAESLTSVSPEMLEDMADTSAFSRNQQPTTNSSLNLKEHSGRVPSNQQPPPFHQLLPLPEHPTRERSAPLAIPPSHVPVTQNLAVSQPSSAGSTASGFLNSLIDPAASTFNSTHISHTPPTHMASSYEASHFGKRARSGVSK